MHSDGCRGRALSVGFDSRRSSYQARPCRPQFYSLQGGQPVEVAQQGVLLLLLQLPMGVLSAVVLVQLSVPSKSALLCASLPPPPPQLGSCKCTIVEVSLSRKRFYTAMSNFFPVESGLQMYCAYRPLVLFSVFLSHDIRIDTAALLQGAFADQSCIDIRSLNCV